MDSSVNSFTAANGSTGLVFFSIFWRPGGYRDGIDLEFGWEGRDNKGHYSSIFLQKNLYHSALSSPYMDKNSSSVISRSRENGVRVVTSSVKNSSLSRSK